MPRPIDRWRTNFLGSAPHAEATFLAHWCLRFESFATLSPEGPQPAIHLRNFLPCFPLRCGEEQLYAVVPVLWTKLVLSENAGQVLE